MTKIFVSPLSALAETLVQSSCANLISLMGPGKTPPRPSTATGKYLSLEFNDIAIAQDGLILPSLRQIEQLIDFLSDLELDQDIVIHCWMGISRSTAAAAIGCAVLNPKLDAPTIASALRKTSPMATPNPLMIELADAKLNMQGTLTAAVAKIGRGKDASEGIPFVLEPHKLP